MFPVENILNIALVVGLCIYWIIAFIMSYHLTRFGIGTQPKKIALLFLFGSVVLSMFVIVLYTQFDLNTLTRFINI